MLKNNHGLAEHKKHGQGWEIDLMTYADTGKANLTLVNKFKKELVNCRQNDIQEALLIMVSIVNSFLISGNETLG